MTQVQPLQSLTQQCREAQQPRALLGHRHTWLRTARSWQWGGCRFLSRKQTPETAFKISLVHNCQSKLNPSSTSEFLHTPRGVREVS